jgi:hypothetical protein
MKVKMGKYKSDWSLADFAPLPFYGIRTHFKKHSLKEINKLSRNIDWSVLGLYNVVILSAYGKGFNELVKYLNL